MNVSPPLTLLITVFFSIFLVLPIGTWLLFVGRHDEKSRLWFSGILLLSIGMLIISLRVYLPVYVSHQLPWIMTLISWLLMIESFRRELQYGTSLRMFYITLVLVWGFLQTFFFFEGWTEGLGLASHALMMVAACGALGWYLFLLNSIRSSKSLLIMMLSCALYVLPNVVRVFSYAITGNQDVMNILKFSWQSNFLSTSYVIAMMAMCFGYWGFTLEKSERERIEALAAENRAAKDAERYRNLIQERDHLLVMNSRFAAISALSSFSAMLIHDISQPLQTLQLGLDRIRANLNAGAPSEKIKQDLEHLERTSDRAGELVTALRNLMQSGETQVTPVLLGPLFSQVAEILNSEALQNQVEIILHNNLPKETQVTADGVMLQRIIFNLVSNSLHQLKMNPPIKPFIRVRVDPEIFDNELGIQIQVIDNAGGFPQELLDRVGQPWSSLNPNSLGLALMLSKQVVSIWGGNFSLSNHRDGEQMAVATIWLQRVG